MAWPWLMGRPFQWTRCFKVLYNVVWGLAPQWSVSGCTTSACPEPTRGVLSLSVSLALELVPLFVFKFNLGLREAWGLFFPVLWVLHFQRLRMRKVTWFNGLVSLPYPAQAYLTGPFNCGFSHWLEDVYNQEHHNWHLAYVSGTSTEAVVHWQTGTQHFLLIVGTRVLMLFQLSL